MCLISLSKKSELNTVTKKVKRNPNKYFLKEHAEVELIIVVPRMSALFFHRPPIYERATDHTYTKGCSHPGKKCGGTKCTVR